MYRYTTTISAAIVSSLLEACVRVWRSLFIDSVELEGLLGREDRSCRADDLIFSNFVVRAIEYRPAWTCGMAAGTSSVLQRCRTAGIVQFGISSSLSCSASSFALRLRPVERPGSGVFTDEEFAFIVPRRLLLDGLVSTALSPVAVLCFLGV